MQNGSDPAVFGNQRRGGIGQISGVCDPHDPFNTGNRVRPCIQPPQLDRAPRAAVDIDRAKAVKRTDFTAPRREDLAGDLDNAALHNHRADQNGTCHLAPVIGCRRIEPHENIAVDVFIADQVGNACRAIRGKRLGRIIQRHNTRGAHQRIQIGVDRAVDFQIEAAAPGLNQPVDVQLIRRDIDIAPALDPAPLGCRDKVRNSTDIERQVAYDRQGDREGHIFARVERQT